MALMALLQSKPVLSPIKLASDINSGSATLRKCIQYKSKNKKKVSILHNLQFQHCLTFVFSGNGFPIKRQGIKPWLCKRTLPWYQPCSFTSFNTRPSASSLFVAKILYPRVSHRHTRACCFWFRCDHFHDHSFLANRHYHISCYIFLQSIMNSEASTDLNRRIMNLNEHFTYRCNILFCNSP